VHGHFIVIEGPDGSGTTTHAKRLGALLQAKNLDICLTREPTDGPIGQEIRRLLHGQEQLDPQKLQQLFTDDRAQHVAEVILPALKKGQIVISDRYKLSTIVYGAAQGVDEQWLRSINEQFPNPELTIVTLPPFEICLQRLGERSAHDQLEERMLQRRVYEGYASLKDPSLMFVDTSGPPEKTAEIIWEHVQLLLH